MPTQDHCCEEVKFLVYQWIYFSTLTHGLGLWVVTDLRRMARLTLTLVHTQGTQTLEVQQAVIHF